MKNSWEIAQQMVDDLSKDRSQRQYMTSAEKAFEALEQVTPQAARNAARSLFIRLMAVQAANPSFTFDVLRQSQAESETAHTSRPAVVIFCSRNTEDTVLIEVASSGFFSTNFGSASHAPQENEIKGNGNDEEDVKRMMNTIGKGTIVAFKLT